MFATCFSVYSFGSFFDPEHGSSMFLQKSVTLYQIIRRHIPESSNFLLTVVRDLVLKMFKEDGNVAVTSLYIFFLPLLMHYQRLSREEKSWFLSPSVSMKRLRLF
jgi:hypothetical protein